MADRAFLQQMQRKLVDDGLLIEAGWIGLRLVAIPLNAPAVQLEEMRNAFFAGAQHLFGSMMDVLEPDAEPTEKDIERMALIDAELRKFIEEFKLRHGLPGGTA